MKILYKYGLKRGLLFLIFIVSNSLDSLSQTYVVWNTASQVSSLGGTFPISPSLNGIATVSTQPLPLVTPGQPGQPLQLTSPAPIQTNLLANTGAEGSQTFLTMGQPWSPPSQRLRFTFSVPVIITQFNVSDINQVNSTSAVSGTDDSFDFIGGILDAFATVTASNCNPTLTMGFPTGVTATQANTTVGLNNAFAIWRNKCNLTSQFEINYRVTPPQPEPPPAGVTCSDLTYSIEVFAPFPEPLGPFCVGSTPPLLPTNLNGIEGTWAPSREIVTTDVQTLDYRFTPNPGQMLECAIDFQIEIINGPGCEICPGILISETTIPDPLNVQRSNYIESRDLITYNGPAIGQGVVYLAGNYIELLPADATHLTGFETGTGAQFAAYPRQCAPNQIYVYRPQNSIPADSKKEELNTLVIYPNPANNSIDILLQKNTIRKLSIVSIDGKKMYETSESKSKIKVDVGKYAKGIYIVHVITDDGQNFSRKLVKN